MNSSVGVLCCTGVLVVGFSDSTSIWPPSSREGFVMDVAGYAFCRQEDAHPPCPRGCRGGIYESELGVPLWWRLLRLHSKPGVSYGNGTAGRTLAKQAPPSHHPSVDTALPSSRNHPRTMPSSPTFCVPPQLCSSMLPKLEAKRSPALNGHPVTEWCMSCCTNNQYMFLRLERLTTVGMDNNDGRSDTNRLTS